MQHEVLSQVWPEKNVWEWSTRWHLIILKIGMKGGKNYILESDADYTLYFLNCLKDKWKFFSDITKRKIPYSRDINFDIGNASSVGERQAKRAFFSKVKGIIQITKDPKTGDNWFERYAKLDIRETFGNLTGKSIEFPAQREGEGKVRLYSFNSEPKSPEGYHFFRFYHDEPSRAKTKADYLVAKAVFQLAENNTRVSFPNRVGKAFAWSYPNETDFDLIVDLYERSLKDDSTYGKSCPTYDFNTSITKEMLKDGYEIDPVEAARIYECIKPASSQNLYHPRTFKLKEAVNEEIKNRVEYKVFPTTRKTEVGTIDEYTTIEMLNIEGDNRVRAFGGDYAINGDMFVIAGGYNKTIDPLKMNVFLNEDWQAIDTNVKPVIDILIIIKAIDAAHPIDYLAAGKVLTALKKAFPNMRSFNTDRMQNEYLRQSLVDSGVKSQTYSFSRKQQFNLYIKKRWCVWNNNLEICTDDNEAHKIKWGGKSYTPPELWVLEGEHLIRENDKITHPEQYSKDVQDAVAICVNDLLQLEAEGGGMTPSTLEEMTDEQFRKVMKQYIDIRYKLKKAEYPEETIFEKAAEELKIEKKYIEVLHERALEIYGENFL